MEQAVKKEKPATENTPEKGSAKERKPIDRNKVLNYIGLACCILLLPILLINATLALKGYLNPSAPPDFFGQIPMIVGTGSMSPTFETTDLIIVSKPKHPESLEKGTIISYLAGSVYVSHRIVDIETDSNGGTMYVTKGDANNSVDTVRVAPEQVIGVYKMHIPRIGRFVLFIQSSVGMITCVLIPMSILFAYYYLKDKAKYKKMLEEKNPLLEESNL